MSDSNQSIPALEAEKKIKERSPSYPAIGLRRAMEFAQKLWETDKRQSVLATRAATNLGFSPKSSAGILALSSMKKYGLLEEEGATDMRKVRLSDAAITILNPSSPTRESLLRDAALKPSIHQDLWDKYGFELPSEATISDYLVFERKFTSDAAKSLIGQYKDTMAYVKLDAPDNSARQKETAEPVLNQAPATPQASLIAPTLPVVALKASAVQSAVTAIPGLIDFPVPLPSGIVAYYRIPATLTETDFTFYQALLTALKAGIVKKSPVETAEA